MRIGIFIGSLGAADDLEGQIQQVVDAERDGFDSLWSAQILGVDALTLFALAGQRTQRIEMGTGVVPTYPRHPLALAQQALTTQAATDGRLTLGIGLSHRPMVEERLGMSFERPALHMREYLSVLRTLVHESSVEFHGEVFNVNAAIQVPSSSPFPILIAALGPRMLHIAGEMAEGTVTWMVGPKTLETHIAPRINAAAEKAGRPKPRVCVGLQIAVTDDRQAAHREAANLFGRYGYLPSYRRMLDIEGVEGPADVAILGNESQVEDQLRALAQAGATDFMAAIFPTDDDGEASVVRTRSLLKGLTGKI
ncbi:MAG: LLM class F420-dependent oxidoreductase [Chloroflexi bacterium]|nr:LLM class F420-dependent oxidoreductase [Chloroflexota bacterium]